LICIYIGISVKPKSIKSYCCCFRNCFGQSLEFFNWEFEK